MKIAFDLDNTVYSQGTTDKKYTDAVVRPYMIEYVNKLYDDGHEIYFYTARHFNYFIFTDNQLKKDGFKYHGLILGKFNYDLLIDDRALRFSGNTDIIDDIIKEL